MYNITHFLICYIFLKEIATINRIKIVEGEIFMKENTQDFIEEITNNFSELFVETYFLRYLMNYPEEKLLEDIEKTNQILHNKILKEFRTKLKKLGYNKTEYEKYLK